MASENAPDADRHIEWARDFGRALEPHSLGVYVNVTSDDADSRIGDAYTDRQRTRLTGEVRRHELLPVQRQVPG